MTQENWRDRDPSDPNAELIKAVRRAAKEAQIEIATYNEGSHSFQKWVLGICGVLVTASVIGGISVFAKLSAVEERTLDIQRRLDRLEKIVEPRYRGETP